MKKLFIIIALAAIFPISGCASFRQIDTTDVIPNKNQINAQLSAEKAKEKAYNATKGGYPDTMVKPVTTPTTTITTITPTQPATTTVQPVKPVKIADMTTPSTTPVATTTTTPISSTPAVIISSTAKKPIREIIIYPDDTPPQDVTVNPASGTQTVKITPTASKPVTVVSASKTPVITTPDITETIYKVLVGKFSTKEAVEPLLAELKESYKEAFIKKNDTKEEYSVQIAASTNEKAINSLVAKLKEKGYKVFVLTVKK